MEGWLVKKYDSQRRRIRSFVADKPLNRATCLTMPRLLSKRKWASIFWNRFYPFHPHTFGLWQCLLLCNLCQCLFDTVSATHATTEYGRVCYILKIITFMVQAKKKPNNNLYSNKKLLGLSHFFYQRVNELNMRFGWKRRIEFDVATNWKWSRVELSSCVLVGLTKHVFVQFIVNMSLVGLTIMTYNHVV